MADSVVIDSGNVSQANQSCDLIDESKENITSEEQIASKNSIDCDVGSSTSNNTETVENLNEAALQEKLKDVVIENEATKLNLNNPPSLNDSSESKSPDISNSDVPSLMGEQKFIVYLLKSIKSLDHLTYIFQLMYLRNQ